MSFSFDRKNFLKAAVTAVVAASVLAVAACAPTPAVKADPSALPTVTADGLANHVVSVGGEVRATGEFPLRQGMTLMSAINRAGGFTEFAKTKAVKLLRGNSETVYDMRKIQANGSNNPVLMDGDQIIVPAG